ncbi:hypothetical protein BO1005MUT1_520104 [Hyphomicrobiales bacterium]|nr:hypothetical protein BO1005MUT1_520104 [Hyphomicrobiales bacterium]
MRWPLNAALPASGVRTVGKSGTQSHKWTETADQIHPGIVCKVHTRQRHRSPIAALRRVRRCGLVREIIRPKRWAQTLGPLQQASTITFIFSREIVPKSRLYAA